MKEILHYLSRAYWKLNKAAVNYILEHCDERLVPKGKILLEEDQICEHVWFVKKGLLRAYQESRTRPGKQFSNWFMTENEIATSVISFFKGESSEEVIVAEEDTIVFEMSKKDLFDGIGEHHCMAMLTLLIVIRYYCDSRFNEAFLRMKEPQFIHQRMLADCPELLQRPLQKELASFLGVSEPIYRDIKSGKSKQIQGAEKVSRKPASRKK